MLTVLGPTREILGIEVARRVSSIRTFDRKGLNVGFWCHQAGFRTVGAGLAQL